MAVHDAISAHWTPPAEIPGEVLRSLAAEVRVRILQDGSIIDHRITRSSGSSDFDASCLDAVKAASPVRPPPEASRHLFARGVVLEFNGVEPGR
jgi:TonB family protein